MGGAGIRFFTQSNIRYPEMPVNGQQTSLKKSKWITLSRGKYYLTSHSPTFKSSLLSIRKKIYFERLL